MAKKLKRAVIKQELVELTGDFVKAVILNQLLYWSERVKDVDRYIEEERQRCAMEGKGFSAQPTHGWIYKSSEELSEETMLKKAPSSMREHIKFLVKNEWLSQRTNPDHPWDRKLQYRVNIAKVQQDLEKLGYPLEGYAYAFSETENGISETKNRSSKTENQTIENRKAITKITTETTTKTTNRDTHNSQSPQKPKVASENDRVCQQVQNVLQEKRISASRKTIEKWLKLADIEDILYAIDLAGGDDVQNPAAFIQGVLRSGVVRGPKKSNQNPYQTFFDIMEKANR